MCDENGISMNINEIFVDVKNLSLTKFILVECFFKWKNWNENEKMS